MSKDDFNFTVDERTSKRVVHLTGSLVLTNVDNFKKPFLDLVEKDKKEILFDMSGLEHIDSSGIGLLLLIHRKLVAAGRNFVLGNLQSRVESIFKNAGLDKMLVIIDNDTQ